MRKTSASLSKAAGAASDTAEVLDAGGVRALLPRRARDAHKNVACQRQGAAQREEQGAEEQKGFFHGAYLPPGQTFGLSIPAAVGKKAHKRGMPCISAQNALSYTYEIFPEKKGIKI